MNKEWSNLHKKFQILIGKRTSFEEGKQALLELRKNLFDMVMLVKGGFPNKGYSQQPCINSKGYDSKTMIYSLYHISRIEDIVYSTLLKEEQEIFFEKLYQKRMNSLIITTGNELKGKEIEEFSSTLMIKEVFQYFKEVYQRGNEYISSLHFEDLKQGVSIKAKEQLIQKDVVSKSEESFWLIDYWCSKDVLGLLKMPFSRHWIMHIEAFLRIKTVLVEKAKKNTKNKIAVCGFSCNHCFLTEWCGTCRSEYNCCSFGTLFEDKICPNVKCAKEKELEGCYLCPQLNVCEIGFYTPSNDGGKAAKASAMFMRKYGKKAFTQVLDKMHQKFDFLKMQEVIGNDSLKGLEKLEEFLEI